MAGLIPFNRRNNALTFAELDDFHNMLDDFFSDNFPTRSLLKDTFKIDIQETETEYSIDAEMPGVKKEDINLGIEDNKLRISVNRTEEVNNDGKNYIHRERRSSSVSRVVMLANAQLDAIKAKLEDGVLTITVPKEKKVSSPHRIEIE